MKTGTMSNPFPVKFGPVLSPEEGAPAPGDKKEEPKKEPEKKDDKAADPAAKAAEAIAAANKRAEDADTARKAAETKLAESQALGRAVFTEADPAKSKDAFIAYAKNTLGWNETDIAAYLKNVGADAEPPTKDKNVDKPDAKIRELTDRMNEMSREAFTSGINEQVGKQATTGTIKELVDKMRKAGGDKPANALAAKLQADLKTGIIDELHAISQRAGGRRLSQTEDLPRAVDAALTRIKSTYADMTEFSPGLGRTPEVSPEEELLASEEVKPPENKPRGKATADEVERGIKDWAGDKWTRAAARMKLEEAGKTG